MPLAQPRKKGDVGGGGAGEDGTRAGGDRDSGWGKRGRQAETVPVRPAKKAKVVVAAGVRADEALGALGVYASDDDEDGDSPAEGGGEEGQGVDDDGEEGEEGEGQQGELLDGADEDEVFDEQPGNTRSLLAGLPPDLLAAMSHAIDADLA